MEVISDKLDAIVGIYLIYKLENEIEINMEMAPEKEFVVQNVQKNLKDNYYYEIFYSRII